MKFSLIFLALAANTTFASVDYSYCQKQLNLFKMPDKPCKEMGGLFTYCSNIADKDSSYYPFELSADGKIKPHPLVNYKNKDGKEVLTSKNFGFDYETVISRNDKGEIENIAVASQTKNFRGFGGYIGKEQPKNQSSFTQKSEYNYKIEIKNGKCVPSRIDSVNSIGDESRQDVIFDLKLCRNVQQFFKKNPEAASCFDKNLMSKAQDIFNDYYKDNKDIYGEVNPEEQWQKPVPLKTKLKSNPNGDGGMYGYPGASGMGVGMGMGSGISTAQMLKPLGPTLDSVLGAPSTFAMNGFGSSPVISAMQVLSTCTGGGFGESVLNTMVNDDSLWTTSSQSQEKSGENITK